MQWTENWCWIKDETSEWLFSCLALIFLPNFCVHSLFSLLSFYLTPHLWSHLCLLLSSFSNNFSSHISSQRSVSVLFFKTWGKKKIYVFFPFFHEDFMRWAGHVIMLEKDIGYQNCISKIKTEEMSELSI